uniref:Uncharacterized protein n=1 Tax=Echinococcus granulosus TaxID=6210 RepID=A0A068WXV4_ECHGR|nr:hypothetical protein EgrG_002031900 [Echinococcus granulosus]
MQLNKAEHGIVSLLSVVSDAPLGQFSASAITAQSVLHNPLIKIRATSHGIVLHLIYKSLMHLDNSRTSEVPPYITSHCIEAAVALQRKHLLRQSIVPPSFLSGFHLASEDTTVLSLVDVATIYR